MSDATGDRARSLMRMLRRDGPTSRSRLCATTGVHANLIGDAIARLLSWGVVRETSPVSPRAGRPALSLEVDPTLRRVLGIAFAPTSVSFASLWLDGRSETLAAPSRVGFEAFITHPKRALEAIGGPDVLAVGISSTGFLDVEGKTVLFSAASGRRRTVSLGKVVASLRSSLPHAPIRLTNDLHALSARYAMQQVSAGVGDTLLIGLDDGLIGASALSGGRPSRGCVLAANELGHSRLAVQTPRCYCGERGCVERIFSTAWVRSRGADASLGELVRRRRPSTALTACLDLTAIAFGNAGNFVRPHRIVLASPFAGEAAFVADFTRRLRAQLLPVLRDRVAIEWWMMPRAQSAENAAWAGFSGWLEGEDDA